MRAFHEFDGRGRFPDLFLAGIDARTRRLRVDRNLGPARHELHAQLFVPAEPGYVDHAAVGQEPFRAHAHGVFPGQQFDRPERRGADLALVDRNDGLGGRVRDHGYVAGQFAHLDVDDHVLLVAYLEILGDVVIALLRHLHGVAALAQQDPIAERHAEPTATDGERIGFAGRYLEFDRLRREQEK